MQTHTFFVPISNTEVGKEREEREEREGWREDEGGDGGDYWREREEEMQRGKKDGEKIEESHKRGR